MNEVRRLDGLKVFSATMQRDRDVLGDRVSQWRADNPQLEIVDVVVTQSSDESFHCLAITVFYAVKESAAKAPAPRRIAR